MVQTKVIRVTYLTNRVPMKLFTETWLIRWGIHVTPRFPDFWVPAATQYLRSPCYHASEISQHPTSLPTAPTRNSVHEITHTQSPTWTLQRNSQSSWWRWPESSAELVGRRHNAPKKQGQNTDGCSC